MNGIFQIASEADFRAACLETFHHQYQNVEIYRRFTDLLNIDPQAVSEIEQIPFLPIEFFKTQKILDLNCDTQDYFQSSGTTQIQTRSRHYIADFGLYRESIRQSFLTFIGDPKDYIILGLLPNYSENQHSSLIYMVDYLMQASGNPENGYFLYNHDQLFDLLSRLQGKKVLLFGVSFALLDFLDDGYGFSGIDTANLTIIETGGMKGRKEEITKAQVLRRLQEGFRSDKVFSEYSMTELLSQAYCLDGIHYRTPNWMRIMIRSTEDPLSFLKSGRAGAINIIDLANSHSCSFIATQDLGKVSEIAEETLHAPFEVLGRIDHSDIRGCSLLVS